MTVLTELVKDSTATFSASLFTAQFSPAAHRGIVLLERLKSEPPLFEKLAQLMPAAGDARIIPWTEFDALMNWLDGKK